MVPTDIRTLELKQLTDFRERLEQRPFRHHPLLSSGHLQTILSPYLNRQFPWGWEHSRQERLALGDGTRMRIVVVERAPRAPTLVAVHGMAGSSDSIYMQALSHKAYREGWNAVLLNLYDWNVKARPPRILHCGSSPQVGDAVAKIAGRFCGPLLMVGVSMGGNIVLKLLGEWGSGHPPAVAAAVAISPLCDIPLSWPRTEIASNTFYRLYFVRVLKDLVLQRSDYFAPFIDLDALNRVKTIREFDERFTAPLCGFRDALDYYRRCSAAPLLKNIRVPTLILHSKDDPLIPWEPLTGDEVSGNSLLLTHLTRHGGHVGFIQSQSQDIDRSWAENRCIDFFRFALGARDPQATGPDAPARESRH